MRMPVTALIVALAVPLLARADDKAASAPAPAKRERGARIEMHLQPGVKFVSSASGARYGDEEPSPAAGEAAKTAKSDKSAKEAPKAPKAKK